MATKYLAPIANFPSFLDSTGAMLSGGKLHTYTAGTTTPEATYKDNAGATAHANPIILDSRGEVTSPVWLSAGVKYKFVLKTALDVTIWTIDNIEGTNDPTDITNNGEWVQGPAPTQTGGTTFTMVGDQTSTFTANRRLKTTDGGGVKYSSIFSATYDSPTNKTTVTVVMDSGTLAADLSDVDYGLLAADNKSYEVETPLKAPFNPVVLPDANVTMTRLAHIGRVLVQTPTVNRVLTLPTTDVLAGEWVEIHNLATAQKFTIESSDLTDICQFQAGGMRLMALQAAPTLATHWRILEVFGGASPAFGAHINATQTIATSTTIKANFLAEDYDNNANYSASNFLPTVPGRYILQFSVVVGPVTTGTVPTTTSLWLNGVEQVGTEAVAQIPTARSLTVPMHFIFNLNGFSDDVEVRIQNSSGALEANLFDGFGVFTGHRIGN